MARHRCSTTRRPPWLASWLLTAALLAALISLPSTWWDAIWPDGRLADHDGTMAAAASFELVEVEVVIPRVEVVERQVVDRQEPTPRPEPDWWTGAWNVRVAGLPEQLQRARQDTSPAAPLAVLRDANAAVATLLARPDSTIDARLWQLVTEEQLGRRDWNGFYAAVAKARAYLDLKQREAAMFNEFGADQVRVPD